MAVNVFVQLIHNRCLIAPLCAWGLAQLLKFILTIIIHDKVLPERLVGSGGMPSAHSATVCALTVASAMTYGVGGDTFALSAVFALVVMYDACGVRRQVGRHAGALNDLLDRESHRYDIQREGEEYHELVGHTPLQVFFGALLGILVAVVICLI